MASDATVDWRAHVGQELRKTYLRYEQDGFFATYFAGPDILDIGYKGYVADAVPILPHAVGVDLDYPGYDGRILPFPDESQDTVFASHALEHIPDFRQALREWFRVLRIGGYMVIAVPHQFLYERKLAPPSRFNGDHRRFYTAGSLMAEIEESLDPMSYRLRRLEDNDADFDYALPPEHHAGGCYELVMVLQRIRRPGYADAVLEPKPSHSRHDGMYREIANLATHEPLMTISPDQRPRRILLLKLDHRGDFITAYPAFRALRASFPEAHITLACGSWTEGDARRLGLFDEVISADFFPEISGDAYIDFYAADGTARFTKAIAGKSFDLAVDLRVDADTRQLLAEVDTKHRAGFGNIQQFPFLDIFLPYSNPTLENRARHLLLAPHSFGYKVGRHEGLSIVHDDRKDLRKAGDVLIFGPWQTFEAGTWRMEVVVEPLRRDFELDYDVCSDSGNVIHQAGALPVRRGVETGFAMALPETVTRLEVRLRARAAGRLPAFRFHGIKAYKKGVYPGLHQQEMQLLLADLVGLRMANPFVEKELTA